MDIRNAKHNTAGGIDCDYMHPVYGWIPYSAHPSDPEQLSRDICAQAILGDVADADLIADPIPQVVTMRQARLALLGAGLLDTVETAIAGAGPAAKIEWEYAQEVQRAAGLIPAMATALGMSEAQIDALFIAAAAL